jgi:anti-sigma factor RsiW
MADHSSLSDEDRENLVAYLDGELDDPAARALEAKLSLDPNARVEAEQMRRAWDLLDYLPRPEPSSSFTHRTLERVSVLRPTLIVNGKGRRWRPWVVCAGWAAAVVLAGAAGFAAVGLFEPKDAIPPELVRDLRIIENKRLYEQVDDIDFLRQLDDPDLFGDDSHDS